MKSWLLVNIIICLMQFRKEECTLKNLLVIIFLASLYSIYYYTKTRPDKNKKVKSIIVSIFMLFVIGVISQFDSANKDLHTTKHKTEKVSKTEQSTKDNSKEKSKVTIPTTNDEQKTFEEKIKDTNIFSEFYYDKENDLYIISNDINSTFGDKKAIEFFNYDIKSLLDKNIKTDKPVVFRGWFENGGYTVAGTIVYFNQDTFNIDWKNRNLLDTEIYKYSDGWISASKFGQYQTANHNFKFPGTEEKLYNIFQMSK